LETLKVWVSNDTGSTWSASSHDISPPAGWGLEYVDVTADFDWQPAGLNATNFRVRIGYDKAGAGGIVYVDEIRIGITGNEYVEREHIFYNYGFNITDTINAVYLGVEQYGDGDDYVSFEYSRNAGGTWISTGTSSTTPKASDDDDVEWERATGYIWVTADLLDANFRVKIIHEVVDTLGTLYVDYVPVKVVTGLDATDWGSGTSQVGNWNTTDYPGNNVFINITLTTTSVNRLGRTQYELRSNRDVDETAPTGDEYIKIWVTEKGLDQEPRLVVVYTLQKTVIFYFYAGGSLLVNGTDTANETSTNYDPNTILNITAVASYSYTFKNHTYDSSSTTDNPFYLTVTQDYTVKTYFRFVYDCNYIGVNSTMAGEVSKFSSNWEDLYNAEGLSRYLLSTNNTGTWVNGTWSNSWVSTYWAEETVTINSTLELTIAFKFYVNDTSGIEYISTICFFSNGLRIFDLTVTYSNGTNVNGTATECRVVFQHYGNGGGVDYNATLGEDGTIPRQTWVSSYNPYNLQITNVTGYQDYNGNFTLSEKTDWTIALLEDTGKSASWYLSGTIIIGFPLFLGLLLLFIMVVKKRH